MNNETNTRQNIKNGPKTLHRDAKARNGVITVKRITYEGGRYEQLATKVESKLKAKMYIHQGLKSMKII